MSTTLLYTRTQSPIGELLLVGDGRALHGLHMQEGRTAVSVQPEWRPADEPFADVREQLSEYFSGERLDFELPLAPDGTAFQRRVWDALQEIPYGETTTYGELARRLGRPSASRAVGLANGRNPIAVIVPCHRVIGSDGSLTGYGGGLERKRFLLEREAARVRRSPATAARGPGS
jgi:methylated-DNA-[protein]-cysteine S-methyltransferase